MGRGRSPSESRSRSRGRGSGGGRRGGSRVDVSKIQELVNERQQARRDRDFKTADDIRDELKDMGVRVDDTNFTWDGPDGTSGRVSGPGGRGGGGGGGGCGGPERRDGDWDCPRCGKLVFASKDECFSCGEPKPRDSGGGRGDDRGRRSSRYDDDDYDDRRRRR
eukprot:TRINITY_DN14472_c0_g1_i1.p1 TRINITY_DN14472_c0_g1~~TRINITY_DN14472_c0_g1_i1.p1  ORF type:complete len:164 (+),score=21.29 TRINITY_DN14472_c0_g1_i1:101-592(+)